MSRKLKLFRPYFTLTALEGLLALFLVFREPSMQGYAGLFGYSAWRLGLGTAILLLICLWAWLAVRAWSDAAWLERLKQGL